MTDPKSEKPESDHPHEDDHSLELHNDQQGPSAGGEEFPVADASMSGSMEGFQFSGPAEELDFTEPSDFTFPTEQPSEAGSEQSGEFAAEPATSESFFGAESFGAEPGTTAESPLSEEAATESAGYPGPEMAGEGITDLEAAEEEAKPKPKFELPAWVQPAQWIMVGVLGVGALLAIFATIAWVKDPKQVTLTLNIACPLMLALIAFSLWRSLPYWVTPAATALYTVMLALSTAALIVGVWSVGLELSRYDWQFSKARVKAGKPPVVFVPVSMQSEEAKAPEAVPPKEPEPAPGKSSAEPEAAKNTAEPAPAKNSAETAPAKGPEFSPSGGGFKVLMPGTPKEQTVTVAGIQTKTFTVVAPGNGVYVITYVDVPVVANESPAQIDVELNSYREGQLKSMGGKLVSESKIQLNGKYPGRDIRAELPSQKYARTQVFIVGTRLYSLTAAGLQPWVDSAETNKFFESFALTAN